MSCLGVVLLAFIVGLSLLEARLSGLGRVLKTVAKRVASHQNPHVKLQSRVLLAILSRNSARLCSHRRKPVVAAILM